MRTIALLIPAALLLGAASLPEAVEPGGLSIDPARLLIKSDGFTELEEEFESAHDVWRQELANAKGTEDRSAIRKANPAIAFWSRFEKLAEAGDGQALFWQVSHLREKGVRARERSETARPMYDRLANGHASAEWFGDVFEQFAKDSRRFDEAYVLGFHATVLDKSESDENKAGALFFASAVLAKSDSPDAARKAESYRARIDSEFAKTTWGRKLAEVRLIEAVQVGQVAPDFDGKTIDGFEFKLSDYRGKVVVLDFYGFW